ncbi:MAG: hypothetical protein HKN22_06060 [Bacteroidia bacterium]|nr:hypothetical protein [Bacteroidia bacterium]
MKLLKYGINGVLAVVVIFLAFWLTKIILDPIQFDKVYKVRQKATIQKLKDIRTAQKLYLQSKGEYANDFNQLESFVKNETVATIKTIGDPEDTSIVVQYDTILEPVMEIGGFSNNFDPDKMRFIPFSEKQFRLEAGEIEKQRVTIPVFVAEAVKEDYLAGLKPKFVTGKKDLQVGSLYEGTDAGNWE